MQNTLYRLTFSAITAGMAWLGAYPVALAFGSFLIAHIAHHDIRAEKTARRVERAFEIVGAVTLGAAIAFPSILSL